MTQVMQEDAAQAHSPNNGVIILAAGHPAYGRYAWNLCATLKAAEPEIKVALVYNGPALNHLTDKQRTLFDELIWLNSNDLGGFGSKLLLYELSPYDTTLYLDADTIWLPRHKPSELFNIEANFTGITEGCTENASKHYYFWGDIAEIRQVYKLDGKIFQWRSEFMLWKKKDNVAKFFETARHIYQNPRLKSAKQFAGHVPDELAINIAAALHNIIPHQYRWAPTYWDRLMGAGNVPDLDTLYSKYYALSCGSNVTSGPVKKVYDRVVKSSCYKLGYQHVFPMTNKRDIMRERQQM